MITRKREESAMIIRERRHIEKRVSSQERHKREHRTQRDVPENGETEKRVPSLERLWEKVKKVERKNAIRVQVVGNHQTMGKSITCTACYQG
jgi:hypothetical protein